MTPFELWPEAQEKAYREGVRDAMDVWLARNAGDLYFDIKQEVRAAVADWLDNIDPEAFNLRPDHCRLCRQPIDDDIHLPGAVSTYHPFASVPVPGS